MEHRRPFWHANFRNYLLAGFLTITPIIAVWWVFNFFLNVLSAFGAPLADRLTVFLNRSVPELAPALADPTVRWLIAVVVALLVLYTIGAIASRVIGQRVIGFFERLIARIPLVETIYSAVKKLIDVLQAKPGGDQRVALIDFPHEGLKTVGFVMRSFTDARTGEELAAVYVPSALNPTSGFLEILPLSKLVMLDVTTDQAMTMVISAGAVVPEKMSIARPEN